MNIKIRLSLQFTLIVAVVLLFFSGLVYYFSYSSQLVKFRQNLYENAKNSSILLIDVAEVDSSLMKKIQQSTISREKEELAITDSAFNILYENNIDFLADRETLTGAARNYVNYFSVKGKDGVCFSHLFRNRSYYVYAMAFDRSRITNLEELRKILLWSILFSIWLSVLLSYLFSTRAMRPISRIIKSVKEINSLKLNTRLDEGDKKDEIAQLAITFNEMLSDLEIAFKNQEDFVSNASHELRTPLSVMISECDYVLSHDRKKEEYVKHLTEINSDLKKLNSLLNNLLELAQIKRDKFLIFKKVRIDEIVFNSVYQTKIRYPGRKIIPRILYPENENDLFIDGNEGLLTIAFNNLLDNACKFSADDVIVEFKIDDNFIKIIISDNGLGIPQSELEDIYRPFSRGSNARFIGGFGIGLSLVSRIMDIHRAEIAIISELNSGTRIDLAFKHYHD
jgi:signal transduction histidine kinase